MGLRLRLQGKPCMDGILFALSGGQRNRGSAVGTVDRDGFSARWKNLPRANRPGALKRKVESTMKLNQSLILEAITNGETAGQALARVKISLQGKIGHVLRTGFWWCQACELMTERIDRDGKRPYCARCGSERLEWCRPVIATDRQTINPEDLR